MRVQHLSYSLFRIKSMTTLLMDFIVVDPNTPGLLPSRSITDTHSIITFTYISIYILNVEGSHSSGVEKTCSLIIISRDLRIPSCTHGNRTICLSRRDVGACGGGEQARKGASLVDVSPKIIKFDSS